MILRRLILCSAGILLLAVGVFTRQITDPITLTSGPISGTLSVGVRSYLGIPYAAPPVGDLRWKEPQPLAPWTETRAMTRFGHACPQNSSKLTGPVYDVSEDCLYLNVWTAAKDTEARLPVMVWIHGGGFTSGAGSQTTYNGENLARRGVVLVTINYRLGLFGFLAHPALSKESPHKASGNYGLLDQLAALKWVQRNIANFGGDSGNVTIFGESAGGVSVCALMTSPLAKGLFQRAIAESGPPPDHLRDLRKDNGTRESAEALGLAFAKRLGIDDDQDALNAMRKKSTTEILAAANQSHGLPGFGTYEYVCVDGYVLKQSPAEVFAAGKQIPVPFLTGTNKDEGTLFASSFSGITVSRYKALLATIYPGYAGELLQLYPATTDKEAYRAAVKIVGDGFVAGARLAARGSAKSQPQTWLYQFTYAAPWAVKAGMGSFHASEIQYIFDTFQYPWNLTETQLTLIPEMMGYWVRFAKTGDPNGDGAPVWPAYTRETDQHLILNKTITVGEHLRQQQCDLFDVIRAERK